MALSDVQPLRRTDQSDKPQDIVIVIQRLAGSHQYNVGDALAGVLLHKQNLIENFAGRQASDQSCPDPMRRTYSPFGSPPEMTHRRSCHDGTA